MAPKAPPEGAAPRAQGRPPPELRVLARVHVHCCLA
jgi:hypothetical protein